MPPSLIIEPDSYIPAWEDAPLHEEIQHFQLPDQDIEVLTSPLLTQSRFLGPEEALGGVYTSSGELSTNSIHLRRGKILAPSNPDQLHSPSSTNIPTLAGRHIYLGWFFNHYGHFILESLARCWPLLDEHDYDGYLFHYHARDATPAPRLFQLLELLNIPRHKVIFITRDLRAEELHIPTQQAVLSRAMSPAMSHLYPKLAERAWKQKKCPAYNSRLYISRRLLPGNMRHAVNEYQLEQYFRQRGYDIIHPQFHELDEQLAMFHTCTHLAGLEGSGLHNILFARAPRETWTLTNPLRLIDSITQAQLDGYRNATSRVLFQEVPSTPCLARETMPFLVTPPTLARLMSTPVQEDPWTQFIWIKQLSEQAGRRKTSVDKVIQDLKLTETEARIFRALREPEASIFWNHPTGTLEQLLQAHQYHRQNDLFRAASTLSGCLPACGHNPDFLLHLARLLKATGELDRAMRLAQEIESMDPGNPVNAGFTAELLVSMGKSDAAIALLRKNLTATPLHRPSLLQLAELLAIEGNYPDAVVQLQKALDLRPADGALYPRLTWYLIQAGDWESARKAAVRALELQPDNPHSHAHLARIELALDNPESALNHLNKAIERTPDNMGLYRMRARLHRRLGNDAAATQDEQHVEKGHTPPT